MPYDIEEMHAYKSKHNSEHENQVMFADGKKWHYLAVKNHLHYLEE